MKLDLNIRTKLQIAFGTVLWLSGLFAAVAAWEMHELKTLQQQTQGKMALLANASNALWELRFGLPQYLAEPNAESRHLVFRSGPRFVKLVDDNLQAFGAMPGLLPDEVQGLRRAVAAFAGYKDIRGGWFALAEQGRFDEAAASRLAPTRPSAVATVQALGELLDTTMRSDALRRDAQQRSADLRLAIAAAVMLLATSAAAWCVYRAVSRPLRRLQHTIARISDGDYEARVALATHDELGQLARNFDRLLDDRIAAQRAAEEENLRLNNSVIAILESVNQLSRRDLTVRAPVSDDAVGTVAQAINALTDEASKVMHRVNRIAGQVAQASGKMQAQAALVSCTAQDERTNVVRMIELATEAARLAESSHQAIGRIATLTRDTISTMERTIGEVARGCEQAHQAGEQMRRAHEITRQLVAQVLQMAELSSVQQTVSAGLLETVRRIGESTERTAQQINAQKDDAGTLLQSAHRLVESVNVFKLPLAT